MQVFKNESTSNWATSNLITMFLSSFLRPMSPNCISNDQFWSRAHSAVLHLRTSWPPRRPSSSAPGIRILPYPSKKKIMIGLIAAAVVVVVAAAVVFAAAAVFFLLLWSWSSSSSSWWLLLLLLLLLLWLNKNWIQTTFAAPRFQSACSTAVRIQFTTPAALPADQSSGEPTSATSPLLRQTIRSESATVDLGKG